MFEITAEQQQDCTKFTVQQPQVNGSEWHFRCERNLLIVDFYLPEDDQFIMLSQALPNLERLIIQDFDKHLPQVQKLAAVAYQMIQNSGGV